jgi:hypothetical protein
MFPVQFSAEHYNTALAETGGTSVVTETALNQRLVNCAVVLVY